MARANQPQLHQARAVLTVHRVAAESLEFGPADMDMRPPAAGREIVHARQPWLRPGRTVPTFHGILVEIFGFIAVVPAGQPSVTSFGTAPIG